MNITFMTEVEILNNPGTKSDIPFVTTRESIRTFWNQFERT